MVEQELRIFNDINRDLEKQQLFFVECWSSMSNVRSLDSDRVSYNNILNSVLELLDLYTLGDKHRASDKRIHVVEELRTFIQNDSILNNPVFKDIPSQLNSIIQEHGTPLENRRHLIISFLEELQWLLKKHYRNTAITELKILLQNGASHTKDSLEKIHIKTNALLSHLITLGMPTSECYLLCRNYLKKRGPDTTFTVAFENFVSKIQVEPQQYTVNLSLDNKSLYDLLSRTSVNTLGDCQFLVQPREGNNRKYIIKSVIHAEAISFSAARHFAEKKLLQALDLFSYFLGKNEINIINKATISSASNETKILPRFDKDLANSLDRWVDDELSVYMNSVTHLRTNGTQKTRNKISAAFRFFQNGVNEKSLESRFTAFWSALESLTLIEEANLQRHDEHVIKAVLPCISLDYPVKQLFALRGCAKSLNWDPIVINGSELIIQTANLGDIYSAFKEPDCITEINHRLEEHPYAQYRFEKFISLCSKPFELAQKVELHERKVELQIHRLYRIRNAIVHNATSHERLELLVVNLEHYLRSTLNALVYTVHKSNSISTPEEAFIRYQYEANRIFSEMDPSRKVSAKKREGEIRSIKNGNVLVGDNKLISWLNMHG